MFYVEGIMKHTFGSAYNKYTYILVYINNFVYTDMNIHVNTITFKEAAITSGSQITVHSYEIGGE
jgi:hypothetical protein